MSPINRKLTADEAQSRLSRRMARTEISPAAAMRSLRTWGLAEEDCQKVIKRLRRENFLNERRYAQAYVHDKLTFQRWGRIKIRAGLFREGIGETSIDKALASIDDSEYRTILRDMLLAKERTLDAKEVTNRRIRLMRFAASRGFETELTFEILDDILPSDD